MDWRRRQGGMGESGRRGKPEEKSNSLQARRAHGHGWRASFTWPLEFDMLAPQASPSQQNTFSMRQTLPTPVPGRQQTHSPWLFWDVLATVPVGVCPDLPTGVLHSHPAQHRGMAHTPGTGDLLHRLPEAGVSGQPMSEGRRQVLHVHVRCLELHC